MSLMKFINNKTTKKIFVVGVLMVGVLLGGTKITSAYNYGIFDKIMEGKMWLAGTTKETLAENDSGIIKKPSGSMEAKSGSIFGDAYNSMVAKKELKNAAALMEEMIALYDKLLPLEDQKVQLLKQSATDNAAQIYQINSQITSAQKELLQKQLNKDNTMGSYFPITLSEADSRISEQEGRAQDSANELIYCFKLPEGFSPVGCVAIFSYIILYLTSWVLFLAALLFDFTIKYTLSMTDLVNGFSAIQYGWEVFRNLLNLFFILILVFISISTILQVDSYGYKKMLGKLVIAAILINFSMFFTKVIIDASNITALVFYKQIMIDSDNQVAKSPEAGDNEVSKTIAAGAKAAADSSKNNLSMGIMNALGLQTVWGVSKVTGGNESFGSAKTTSTNPAIKSANAIAGAGGAKMALTPWNMTLVGLGGSVFVLMLAFIFFAASFMLLIRTVILIMLLVTSPIAFAANVLPQTAGLSSRWWKKLTSAVLFAPVYMLLMFVTLKMIWGRSDKVTDLLSILSNSGNSAINSIFFFFLLCAMLVMCLTVAASVGAAGSKTMNSWGKSLGTKAKNYAASRSFAPISYIADKASKNRVLSRIPGVDKLAQAKIGGSSYRSRVADSEKFYQERGEFIKKNATGTLIRKVGETEQEFKKRKDAAEGVGFAAQKAYLGIKKNDAGEEVRGIGFLGQGGRNVAANKFLETASKKSKDPNTAVIKRAQGNIINILDTGIEAALTDAEGSKHISSIVADEVREYLNPTGTDAVPNFKKDDDGNIIGKDLDPDKIYTLISKIGKPLSEISKEMSKVEGEITTHAKTIQEYDKSTATPIEKDSYKKAIKAITASQANLSVLSRKKSDFSGIIGQLTTEVRRIEDANAQNKLSGAIEENKPKP